MIAWAVGGFLGALLTCAAVFSLLAWRSARRLGKLSRDVYAIRMQLANIITMLLRAGFKRGPRPAGWNDDELKTQQQSAQLFDTKWDWRKPGEHE